MASVEVYILADIAIEIGIASGKAERILADKAAMVGIVEAGAVVLQAGLGIDFLAGVLIAVAKGSIRLRGETSGQDEIIFD